MGNNKMQVRVALTVTVVFFIVYETQAVPSRLSDEQCELNDWYERKKEEGLFDGTLSLKQTKALDHIRRHINKKRGEIVLVRCESLRAYERMLQNGRKKKMHKFDRQKGSEPNKQDELSENIAKRTNKEKNGSEDQEGDDNSDDPVVINTNEENVLTDDTNMADRGDGESDDKEVEEVDETEIDETESDSDDEESEADEQASDKNVVEMIPDVKHADSKVENNGDEKNRNDNTVNNSTIANENTTKSTYFTIIEPTDKSTARTWINSVFQAEVFSLIDNMQKANMPLPKPLTSNHHVTTATVSINMMYHMCVSNNVTSCSNLCRYVFNLSNMCSEWDYHEEKEKADEANKIGKIDQVEEREKEQIGVNSDETVKTTEKESVVADSDKTVKPTEEKEILVVESDKTVKLTEEKESVVADNDETVKPTEAKESVVVDSDVPVKPTEEHKSVVVDKLSNAEHVQVKESSKTESVPTFSKPPRNQESEYESQVTVEKERYMKIQEIYNDYTSKVQQLELQVLKLENKVLVDTVDKGSRSATVDQLENHILKLENDLLKLNQSLYLVHFENNILRKKQKSQAEEMAQFRENDEQNTKYPALEDKNSNMTGLVADHHSKIDFLKNILENQTAYLGKLENKAERLETQNQLLIERLLNQSMIINDVLGNMNRLQQEQLKQKDQVNLAMDSLEKAKIEKENYERKKKEQNVRKIPLTLTAPDALDGPQTGEVHVPQLEKQLGEFSGGHVVHNADSVLTDPASLEGSVSNKPVDRAIPLTETSQPSIDEQDDNIDSILGNFEEDLDDNDENGFLTKELAEELEEQEDMNEKKETEQKKVVDKDDVSKKDAKEKELAEELEKQKDMNEKKEIEKKKVLDKDDVSKKNAKAKELAEELKKQKDVNEKKETEKQKVVDKDDVSKKDAKAPGLGGETADKQVSIENKPTSDKADSKISEKQQIGGDIKTDKSIKSKDNIAKKESVDSQTPNKKQLPETTATTDTDRNKDKTSAPPKEQQNVKDKPEVKDKKGASELQNEKKIADKNKDTKNETPNKSASPKKEASVNPNEKDAKSTSGSEKSRVPVPRYMDLDAKPASTNKDCYDLYTSGRRRDTSARIRPAGFNNNVDAYCDMGSGGWTVIMRRQDGSVNFFRNWADYKKGFGAVSAEHWIGNEVIHTMTNQDYYSLRIDMLTWSRQKAYVEYDLFMVDTEENGYRLYVDGYSGSVPDGLLKHSGYKFSTYDVDNDTAEKDFDGSCSKRFYGAWWYYKCFKSQLTGRYYKGGAIADKKFDGIVWKPWTGTKYSLKKVEMKIRPRRANQK